MKRLAVASLLALLSLSSLHAFEEGFYYYLSSEFMGDEKVMRATQGKEIFKVELAERKGGADKQNTPRMLWKITPEADGYFRLTTKFFGVEYSLDATTKEPVDNQIQLTKTGNFSGQFWKITEIEGGYFRLTTDLGGEALSLDVYNEGADNKRLGLLPSENVSGQSWKFTKGPKVKEE